jgi:serine/threonine protein kinase
LCRNLVLIDSDLGAPFNERQLIFLCHEVLNGLVYLHSLGILHRDIKGTKQSSNVFDPLGANVLLTSKGEVKIGDFGSCGSLKALRVKKSENFVGTPYWYVSSAALLKNIGWRLKFCIV